MARKHKGILQKINQLKRYTIIHSLQKRQIKKKPKESLCNLSLEKTLEKKAYSELWGFFTLKKKQTTHKDIFIKFCYYIK